jgi:hydroxypyruvate reductase
VLGDVAAEALDAVDPQRAVAGALSRRGETLRVGELALDRSHYERILVLGFGKAAAGMARGLLAPLRGWRVEGALVVPEREALPPFEVLEGSHPLPDRRSLAAGRRLLELAAGAGPRDAVFTLISGGGSALVEVPAGDLGLGDLRAAGDLLLRSGADITAFNTVRKHLSAFKGGRLAEAASGASALVTLVISDVVGNALDAIASGPTVADPTSYADALGVLDDFGLRERMPPAVVAHLAAGAAGANADTPSGGALFERAVVLVVADAVKAADAAASAAVARGVPARVVTTTLRGEAREVAHRVVGDAVRAAPGTMLVYAGETTVTVVGSGTGGRNQELALAASLALEGRDDIVVMALGTDGIDGVTRSAGGFGDGSAVARGRALGLDAADHLARNDSHSFLGAVGDTIDVGPTGTNVGDLVVAWRLGDAAPAV